MTALRFFIGVSLGVMLGISMLIVGGIPAPAAPACPGCAVLTQPRHGCNEAVQGGFICP